MNPRRHHSHGPAHGRLRTLSRGVYLTSAGVWLTGVLWLLFRYFLRRETDFGTASNPLEHWWLVAHGAFAFACLWLLGFLWRSHVVQGWKARRHRRTGGALFGAFMLLVISGYLLYYAASDAWHANVALLHWSLGLALPVVFIMHWAIRRRGRSAPPRTTAHCPVAADPDRADGITSA
ncbi:MAG TPA: hypothetical protein VMI92_01320 [Steroidobacteraceae bacterium]|nr:hypothetical protein [Steroidobacteraceae bacterium]